MRAVLTRTAVPVRRNSNIHSRSATFVITRCPDSKPGPVCGVAKSKTRASRKSGPESSPTCPGLNGPVLVGFSRLMGVFLPRSPPRPGPPGRCLPLSYASRGSQVHQPGISQRPPPPLSRGPGQPLNRPGVARHVHVYVCPRHSEFGKDALETFTLDVVDGEPRRGSVRGQVP